jgi:hypothetical protein
MNVSEYSHGFWTKGGSDHKDLPSANFTLNGFLCSWTPPDNLHLQRGVFLWTDTFAVLPVMVHAWLTVLGTVNGITFTELDFSEFVELVDLPADKSIVVGVGVGRKEGTTPVDTRTERVVIGLWRVSV